MVIQKILVQVGVWMVVVGLSACGESGTEVVAPSQLDAVSEHERLNAYLAEVHEENLARRPFTASYLGRKDRQGEWNSQS